MLSYLCAGENGSVHCSALLPFALDGEGLKPEPVSAQEPAEIKVERFRMQQRSCYRNKAEQTYTKLSSFSIYLLYTDNRERVAVSPVWLQAVWLCWSLVSRSLQQAEHASSFLLSALLSVSTGEWITGAYLEEVFAQCSAILDRTNTVAFHQPSTLFRELCWCEPLNCYGELMGNGVLQT